jgi:hypothetical protein
MRIERLARSRDGTPIQNIDTVLASTELGITVSRKTIRCPAVPLWTALIGCAHLPLFGRYRESRTVATSHTEAFPS